ncbi:MAG: hypothetical protein SGPRY_005657, partial [Prymnesium sp.]
TSWLQARSTATPGLESLEQWAAYLKENQLVGLHAADAEQSCEGSSWLAVLKAKAIEATQYILHSTSHIEEGYLVVTEVVLGRDLRWHAVDVRVRITLTGFVTDLSHVRAGALVVSVSSSRKQKLADEIADILSCLTLREAPVHPHVGLRQAGTRSVTHRLRCRLCVSKQKINQVELGAALPREYASLPTLH